MHNIGKSKWLKVGAVLMVLLMFVTSISSVEGQVERRRVNRGRLRNISRVGGGGGGIARNDCYNADGTRNLELEQLYVEPDELLYVYHYARRAPNFVLNIRSAPSVNARIIGTISTNDPVLILDDVDCVDGYLWRTIIYRGRYGWAAEYNLSRRFLIPMTETQENEIEPDQRFMVCASGEMQPDEIIEYDVTFTRGERISFWFLSENSTPITVSSEDGTFSEMLSFEYDWVLADQDYAVFQAPETGTYHVSLMYETPPAAAQRYTLFMWRFEGKLIATPPQCDDM